jgi:glycosyltransferase involved in cell wall biosynthesis
LDGVKEKLRMMGELNNLRLGIITGSLGARNEEGKIIVNFALGRLLEELKYRFPKARLCLPLLQNKMEMMNHVLCFPENDITFLPPLRTTLTSQRYFFSARRFLRRFANESDVLFIRLPFQLPVCLLGLRKPKLLQVVSNPLGVINASTDYHGIMKPLAKSFAKHTEKTMLKLVKEPQTRIVTNGREMWDVLGCSKGRIVVSTCIYKREMKPRMNFELNNPPQILFVGYVRPEKGIETLLEAFTSLRRKRELRLTIAGGSDRSTNAEKLALQGIQQNPFHKDITFTGMLDFGEPLFELFRTHDVYVLSSLSEGTPRTIVEARCFGCPVVATKVGGVPSSVEDGVDGLLVEPKSANQMATAIEKILDDEKLRLELIENGLARSHEFSLEHFADTLVEEIKLLLSD